jgi:putative ABC transport system permease protein
MVERFKLYLSKTMLQNYLKIAFRNLVRNKVYSFINIGGLAVGMATCLLISLYVLDEISYDRFNEKADRICRLDMDIKFGGSEKSYAVSPAPAGPAFLQDYPFIENYVRIRENSIVIKKGNETIAEGDVAFADSSLFEVFTFPMLYGNPKEALKQPNSVVITESIAKKYFNTSQVLGKFLTINKTELYKITGVIKDIPENSHIKRNIYMSMLNYEDSKRNVWISNNYNTYLLLKKGASFTQLKAKFSEVQKKYLQPEIFQILGIKTIKEFERSGNYLRFDLMPLTQIHLYSNKVAEISTNSNIQYVYIFSAVALFILLIACVNFMNLSTARSVNRAKEVGVRKVLGTVRSYLIGQFLSESIFLSLIAFILGFGIAYLLLPYFNDLATKQMNLSLEQKPFLLPVLLLFSTLIGLLAGIYPALILSNFKPISVLKGKLTTSNKGGYLRNGLVVFQFFASVFLIICTIIIYRQLNFIQNKNLGFNREQVLVIHDTNLLGTGLESFKNELLQLKEAKSATISGFLPTPSFRSSNSFWPEGELNAEKGISMQFWEVGHEYTKTLGMQLLQGRDFDRNMSTDSSALVINESAAKIFGYKNPIGKKLFMYADVQTKRMIAFTIIGVVKNFNYESLRENVGAMSMCLSTKSYGMISIRLQTDNIKEAIAKIENKWKSRVGVTPLNYQFLDEAFDGMYRSEQRIGKIFISFAILAIFIACLGLFGLATFTAEQRTKEIGIRKVMGASVTQIVQLLSKDLLRLVILGIIVASPIAYYFMNKWLQDFAYQVEISWWIFALAGLISITIALLTVSYQAIKAAVANPVKSLRTE